MNNICLFFCLTARDVYRNNYITFVTVQYVIRYAPLYIICYTLLQCGKRCDGYL